MPIKVITEFPDKATVRIIVYVKDDNDDLVGPTAVKISIWDPDGGNPVVDGTNIVSTGKVEDGIYQYYYHKDESADPMKAGQWRGEVAVIDDLLTDAIISLGSFSFKVR